MSHEADPWIASHWMGKTVKQVSSCDGPLAPVIGRTSIVVEAMFDEKGALHCLTQDGHWCPAARLEIVSQGE